MAVVASTLAETKTEMLRILSGVVPEVEIILKAELVYEINRLKREQGAIILGHNYMEPVLFHTVPDVIGDSLHLSREAARTTRNPIIFCGVRFMAETAKILNPSKKVILPAKIAGCSLAESIKAADVLKLREQYPGVPIVAYINTYADVKAEVDICCTSGNAAQVVQSLPGDTVIFLPDEYLARNIAKETGKNIIIAGSEQTNMAQSKPIMIGWRGRCEVHERFTVQDIRNARAQYPDVVVIAHPECSPEVVAASDYTGSTTELVRYVKSSSAKRFLILTECSMSDNILAENPDKEMLRMCSIRCPHMHEITLEETLTALRTHEQEIDVPEPTRTRARRSLERMIAIGPAQVTPTESGSLTNK